MCVREIFSKPNNFCVDVCRCVVVGNIVGQNNNLWVIKESPKKKKDAALRELGRDSSRQGRLLRHHNFAADDDRPAIRARHRARTRIDGWLRA